MNYSKATRIVKWSTYSVSQQKRDADALMFLLLCSRESFQRWENTTSHPLKNKPTVTLWLSRCGVITWKKFLFSELIRLCGQCLRLLWPSMFVKGPKQLLRRTTRRDKIERNERATQQTTRTFTLILNEVSLVVYNVSVPVAPRSGMGLNSYIIQDVNVPLFPRT